MGDAFAVKQLEHISLTANPQALRDRKPLNEFIDQYQIQ
jgi:hypothetical protein